MRRLSLLTHWPRVHATEPGDACSVGTILRALLAVQAAMGVAALWGAGSAAQWLLRTTVFVGLALPGTLAWVLARCGLQRVWPLSAGPVRLLRDMVLGALAGGYVAMLSAWGSATWAPGWLAFAVSGAALAGVLGVLLHWRERARTPAATAARLGELQARIRPHFLFNTLNSAITLVRSDPQRAERVLEDLSDLFRAALADSRTSVTLADEVALARRYLDIEHTRFGDRLRVDWVLDPAADTARLPPLLLQPLVENAVRHGVEPSPSGGTVQIRTQRQGSVVRVHIVNSLPSPDATPVPAGHGLALDNVRQRLSLLHDVQASLSARRRDDRFEVVVEVPL